jgi:transposase-like protein
MGPAPKVGPPNGAGDAGNVARTARALGVHRTQLRRWLDRHGVDPKTFGGDDS